MNSINWADTNTLIIVGLIFLLGLLIGMFLTAGGRRKWKARYREETTRREQLERDHQRHQEEWTAKEKDWRERDSLRDAAIRSNRDPATDRPL